MEKFLNIQNFGDLYIESVLLQYTFPRIFICEDDSRKKYLFYEISENTSHDKWLVKEINMVDYQNIINGQRSVESYLRKENTYLISKDCKNDLVDCRKALECEKNLKNEYYV